MAAKIGVRLDAADQNTVIRPCRKQILIERRAIGDLADLLDLHRRLDLTADAGFGDPQFGQHVLLSFGGRATVAAHRRQDKGFHPRLTQPIDSRLDDNR